MKNAFKSKSSLFILFPLVLLLVVNCQKSELDRRISTYHPSKGSDSVGSGSGIHNDSTVTNLPDSTIDSTNVHHPDTTIYSNISYRVSPKTTDPLIRKCPDDHFISLTTNPVKRNLLYVFLPGTYRNPVGCQATVLKAATLGFHSVGLMYDNSTPVNPICRDGSDITCHSRARREVVDGVDRHPEVNTNTTESIINRLVKLLQYLSARYPTQGWNQFLDGQQPNWRKIIIAGHSQGGCLAGVIGKFYPVKRVIMLSAVDYMRNGLVPDWEQLKTNKERYFALINTRDEQVPYNFARLEWGAMGMFDYGSAVDIATGAPYGHTHTLISTMNPPNVGGDRFHNSMGVDSYLPKNASGKYVFDEAWEYLLTEGL